MALSGCRVRRLLVRRQRSDVSQSRSVHDNQLMVDSVLDSDYSDSLTSDDELFDTTGSHSNDICCSF